MKWEHLLTIIFALIIGYLLYLIMLPFWVPILWSVVLTILFYPIYQWLRIHLRSRESIASLLTCVLVFAVLTLPIGFLLMAFVNEMIDTYHYMEGYLTREDISLNRIMDLPVISFISTRLDQYIDLSQVNIKDIILKSLKEASTIITQNITGIVRNITGLFINVILSFMTMYYLFKEGDKILIAIKELIPLLEESKDSIFRKKKDLIIATIYGGVMVSLIQGVLGGVAVLVLGIPSPIFWGIFMAFLAFLPFVGPSLVLVPASIYLIVKGSYIKAVILIVWCVLVVGMIDNILRPLIVSGRTQLHPIFLIFTVFGGLMVFGFIGIIAGPIVLSLALALVDIYKASLKETK